MLPKTKNNFQLIVLFIILLVSVGAIWRGEKTAGSKNTMALTATGTLNKETIMNKIASLAVPFVVNAGRFNPEVRFSAELFAGRFFLTSKELVYSLKKQSPEKNVPEKGLAFREYFADEKGGRIFFIPEGEEKGATKVSYFRGNDPSKWQSGLASYNRVSLGEVYRGIDVKLKACGKNVEKIFYVSPKTEVAKIKIGIAGVQGLKITKDGRLLFKNGLGELAMRTPVAWQEISGQRHEVKVGYRLLNKNHYGFEINGDYDQNYPLVIDPALDTLLASTYLGGSGSDHGESLALDGEGNVYVTGSTYSADFPTTPQACERTKSGHEDIFISKLNNNLTEMLASTYLCGNSYEVGISIALDRDGNVYLSGHTSSNDFPTTPGAYDRTYNGGSLYNGDAFVSKLNGSLATLLASTYLGGSDDDQGKSLVLDGSGNVYLAGTTKSVDFPTTVEAFDRIYNGEDAFISKMDLDLTNLKASTFVGGNDSEHGNSLALDRSGNVFLTGETFSADFPTTPGAYDRTYNYESSYYLDADAYVSKLNGGLTRLIASTYLGGADFDCGNSLAVDGTGNVYVAGATTSWDFPTTMNAYDRTYDPFGRAFISKLDSDLNRLLASTFFGTELGSDYHSNSIALDGSGNVYVTGGYYYEYGIDSQGSGAFVHKLNGNLTSQRGSRYFDATTHDWSSFLALDRSGSVFLTGSTGGWHEFPTTPGAFDRTENGERDAIIVKLNGGADFAVISPNGGESWVAGSVHDITWKSSARSADARIEISTDNGNSWSDIGVSPARYHQYPWAVPNTPSGQCRIRVSDIDNAAISDTSDEVFSILMNIDLQAEWREVRAFSIACQYGRIHFLLGNSSVQVAQYRIMRRKGSEDFVLFKTIAPSESKNNQFQMQDKYLEKGTQYAYRVEAYDAAGQLVGVSMEKTI